jgi:hypothetical protein
MTPHSLVEAYRCFRRRYCLSLQCKRVRTEEPSPIPLCIEEGGSTFLQNVEVLPDYTASLPR